MSTPVPTVIVDERIVDEKQVMRLFLAHDEGLNPSEAERRYPDSRLETLKVADIEYFLWLSAKAYSYVHP
jgi:hypothetical protein